LASRPLILPPLSLFCCWCCGKGPKAAPPSPTTNSLGGGQEGQFSSLLADGGLLLQRSLTSTARDPGKFVHAIRRCDITIYDLCLRPSVPLRAPSYGLCPMLSSSRRCPSPFCEGPLRLFWSRGDQRKGVPCSRLRAACCAASRRGTTAHLPKGFWCHPSNPARTV